MSRYRNVRLSSVLYWQSSVSFSELLYSKRLTMIPAFETGLLQMGNSHSFCFDVYDEVITNKRALQLCFEASSWYFIFKMHSQSNSNTFSLVADSTYEPLKQSLMAQIHSANVWDVI